MVRRRANNNNKSSVLSVAVLPLLLTVVVLLSHCTSSCSSLSSTSKVMSAPSSTDVSVSVASAAGLAERLLPHCRAYAAAHALQTEVRGPKDDDEKDGVVSYRAAPMSLLPNAFPRAVFETAVELAPHFNVLVDRVSRDADFLRGTLRDTADADPFTGRLLKMYEEIYCGDAPRAHTVSADRLGILRSDYMLNPDDGDDDDGRRYALKQVELNTVASSFAGLATRVADMHRYLLDRFGDEDDDLRAFLAANAERIVGDAAAAETGGEVPRNEALDGLAAALADAQGRYADRHGDDGRRRPVVLFVVQEGETNTVDQRLLEHRLWSAHRVPVVRASLGTIAADWVVSDDDGRLAHRVDGREAAVIYYRAGYSPDDYLDASCWEARRAVETSRATKCPNLGYHLAGTKKVQQTLARPGALERFFPDDPAVVVALRRSFAGLHSLSTSDATAADLDVVRSLLNDDDDDAATTTRKEYVLKPQREGGGHNHYGADLLRRVRANARVGADGDVVVGDALAGFVLMERLFPPAQRAVLTRAGRVEGEGDAVSELGVFGCVLADGRDDRLVRDACAGFLLRTKFVGVDEGGVASGFATLSSPYLC